MDNRSFLLNRFQSDEISPIRIKRPDVPPVLEKTTKIGIKETLSGTFYTSIKLQVKPASINFPQPAIFVGFNGGNHSVFSKITLEDIGNIITFFTDNFPEVEQAYKAEVGKAEFIKQQLEAYQKAQEAAAIAGLGNNTHPNNQV